MRVVSKALQNGSELSQQVCMQVWRTGRVPMEMHATV